MEKKMRKEHKQILPLRLPQYPTIQVFEKFVDNKLNRKIIDGHIGPDRPIIPNYLTELHESENPFTNTKYQTTKTLQNLENRRKEFDKQKRLNCSVNENVSRTIRNKFSANFMLREFQYKLDKTEYQEKVHRKKSSETPHLKTFERIKQKPNYDFIWEKRKICLLDLAKQIKIDQVFKLDKVVETEDRIIKIDLKNFVKDQLENDRLLKNVCEKTSDALKMLDNATLEKNEISQKLKRANFIKEQMNSDCIKLDDEYLRLKSYQTFVFSCYTKKNRKLSCVSAVSDVKISTLLNEMEKETKISNDESQKSFDTDFEEEMFSFVNASNDYDFRYSRNDIININNDDIYNKTHFDKCIKNMRTNKFFILSKVQLEKLNKMITMGYSNTSNNSQTMGYSNTSNNSQTMGSSNTGNQNQTVNKLILISEPTSFLKSDFSVINIDSNENDIESHEDDILFSHPSDLINVISDLETNNLNLIENVQEQEEICDNMINRLMKIKNDMDNKVNLIDNLIMRENNNIDQIENSIDVIRKTGRKLMKLNNIDRYRSIFYLEDLCIKTIDELLDYMIKQVCVLYSSIFDEDDSDKNIIERLCRIELYIDSLYVNIRSFNINTVMKAKKSVDDRKRELNRIKQKQLFKQLQLKILRDAMEKAKLGPKYRFGRKIIDRSPPLDIKPKFNSIKTKHMIKQEENQLFFE